jgi:hypothetical protein
MRQSQSGTFYEAELADDLVLRMRARPSCALDA